MKISLKGSGMDRMPDVAFRMMSLMFAVRDRFVAMDKRLDDFGLRPGQTVVDYGCGPGSYIRKAAALVGESGRVYAVDIHELAVATVEKRIEREGLDNVRALLAPKGKCPLADDTADAIYALDMFHMVADPTAFLKELNRISRPEGVLFIDNGHQSRAQAKAKIAASGAWEIVREVPRYLQLRPIKPAAEVARCA